MKTVIHLMNNMKIVKNQFDLRKFKLKGCCEKNLRFIIIEKILKDSIPQNYWIA